MISIISCNEIHTHRKRNNFIFSNNFFKRFQTRDRLLHFDNGGDAITIEIIEYQILYLRSNLLLLQQNSRCWRHESNTFPAENYSSLAKPILNWPEKPISAEIVPLLIILTGWPPLLGTRSLDRTATRFHGSLLCVQPDMKYYHSRPLVPWKSRPAFSVCGY